MTTLTRGELEDYTKYAERMRDDIRVCLDDLRFRENVGALHFAVDFSEIHAFLVRDDPPDDWLWPGIDESTKAAVEHCALSEVLTGPPKPFLLPPYFVEFRNFLSAQAVEADQRLAANALSAIDQIDVLLEDPDAQELLKVASQSDDTGAALTSVQVAAAARFFEARASALVAIVKDELGPLDRARAFLGTNPFQSLDSIAPIVVTGSEDSVTDRFKRLRAIRGRGRDGAAYVDAVALELVRQANLYLQEKKSAARVLLVSRSSSLKRLVDEEDERGLWPTMPWSVIRHPRIFAALAWHARRSTLSPIGELEATLSSLELCIQSAKLRLHGTWRELDGRSGDRELLEQVERVKKSIVSLVEMGGGVNESRVVTRSSAVQEHEVLRLLSLLRSKEQILAAVVDRMSAINRQVDMVHELVGMMLQVRESGETLAERATNVGYGATLAPRMSRFPYAIRFRSDKLARLLDAVKGGAGVSEETMRSIATDATASTTDHYETVLFMAYALALRGRYGLAQRYASRALESAKHHQYGDIAEARFLLMVCGRVAAEDREDFAEVLAQADEMPGRDDDARCLAEKANILIKWHERARHQSGLRPAPRLQDALALLSRAATLASADKRLMVSILNSRCYAATLLYESSRSKANRSKVVAAVDELLAALYDAEPDAERWPVRVKDTIVRAILAEPSSDLARLTLGQELLEQMRQDVGQAQEDADRAELQASLLTYDRKLNRVR